MLYVHVPFCRQRCIYCDFYSTTSEQLQEGYLQAVERELCTRRDYLPRRTLSSVYIGGGTPSTLGIEGLERLFRSIARSFTLDAATEVTVELNPDDVSEEFARRLRGLPVNRVSLGVQTFDDDELRLLRRRHTSRGAVEAVERLCKAGFSNMSIDLIYGLPGQTRQMWQKDVRKALRLPVAHLSAYALSYEEGTVLQRMAEKGQIEKAGDELCEQMYFDLLDRARAVGLVHYEISNFARPGFESRHNSGYWGDQTYLGVGPGAHSYNGTSRRWNKADLREYVERSEPSFEEEQLTPLMLRNEMVMKRLRTAEGLSLSDFSARFGEEQTKELLRLAAPHIERGMLRQTADGLVLTRSGLFVSDDIMSDLFLLSAPELGKEIG